MIIITGSSGFIGGALTRRLIKNNINNIVLCDFSTNESFNDNMLFVETDQLFDFIDQHQNSIDWIFHLGAFTDTTCSDKVLLDTYNLNYSIKVWKSCVKYSISFMYASSAATYGSGNLGFIDTHNIVDKLAPLNLYAKSKNDFDQFVLQQKNKPPFWFGFKFFNVFGFDESKKGNMSSIIYQAFHKIRSYNKMQLFKSYNQNFPDGLQERDFIYIDDVINVILFFMNNNYSGIYNVGSGKSTSYFTLIEYIFNSMNIKTNIEFVDMPVTLRGKYQYSTQADLNKLKSVGYSNSFVPISDAIDDYILNYLMKTNN